MKHLELKDKNLNKNKNMKKVLGLLLLCCFCALSLAGCQKNDLPKSAIVMQIASYSSSVEQTFSLPANTDYYRDNGVDKQTISEYVEALTTSVKTKIWNKIFLNYFLIYSQNPSAEFALDGDQIILNQVKYNASTDTVSFSFVFKSIAAWNYYHPSTGNEETEDNQENGISFVDVNSSSGIFPFAQLSADEPVGYVYAKLIQDEKETFFPAQLVSEEPKVSFVYDYATTHKRVHSNADYVYSGTLYHHVWIADYDELSEDKTIELYTVNAVRGWWYLTALLIALLVAVVGVIVIYVLKKRKPKVKNNIK